MIRWFRNDGRAAAGGDVEGRDDRAIRVDAPEGVAGDPFAARLPFSKRRAAGAAPADERAPRASDPFAARMPFAGPRPEVAARANAGRAERAGDPFLARMPFAPKR